MFSPPYWTFQRAYGHADISACFAGFDLICGSKQIQNTNSFLSSQHQMSAPSTPPRQVTSDIRRPAPYAPTRPIRLPPIPQIECKSLTQRVTRRLDFSTLPIAPTRHLPPIQRSPRLMNLNEPLIERDRARPPRRFINRKSLTVTVSYWDTQ